MLCVSGGSGSNGCLFSHSCVVFIALLQKGHKIGLIREGFFYMGIQF